MSWCRLAVVAALLGGLSASPAAAPAAADSPADAADTHIDRFVRYLMDHDFVAADVALAAAVALAPDTPKVRFHVATSCWWQEVAREPDGSGKGCLPEITAAIAATERRLEREPEDPMANYYLGRAYGMRARVHGIDGQYRKTIGDMRRAHRYLARAESIDPAIADISVDMGVYKYMATQLPTFAKIVRVLLFLPGGNREEGLERLRTVAEGSGLAADEALMYLSGIDVQYEGQPARGAARLQLLRERHPRNPFVYLHLGRALRRRLWQPREALAVYRQALPLVEHDTAAERWLRMSRGMCHLMLGDLDRAEALLTSVKDDLDSTGDEALLGLVRAALLRGDRETAERHHRALRGRDRRISKRYAGWAKDALDRPAPEQERRFVAQWQAAHDAERRADRDGARRAYRLALAVIPRDDRALDGLAALAAADDDWHTVVAIDPELATRTGVLTELRARANLRLARAYRALGHPDLAFEHLIAIEPLDGLPELRAEARCELVDLARY